MGTLTLYCNICFPLNAAATNEITLNVFLLLAFPVDALKFPNVPITESELLIVIMIGGSKNLSVIFTIALSNADKFLEPPLLWLKFSGYVLVKRDHYLPPLLWLKFVMDAITSSLLK